MKLLRKFRMSMALVMMLVVVAATASALFAKSRDHIPNAQYPYMKVDVPAVFIISIALTSAALGAWKSHSAGQIMLQITLANLSYLGLIGLAEAHAMRPLLYWFQVGFALQVVIPLVIRSYYVKPDMERGPRRKWWKKTTEAFVFSFFSIVIVLISGFLQWITALVLSSPGPLNF